MENFRIILLLALVIFISSLSAQGNEENSFVFYPFGAYTTETNIMLGSYMRYSWEDSTLPENQLPTFLEANIIASIKSQFRILTGWHKLLANNKNSLEVNLRLNRWPSTFYKLHQQDEPREEEGFTPFEFELEPSWEYRTRGKLRWKAGWSAKYFSIIKEERDNPLLSESIDGFDDYRISGPEFNIKLTTIDIPFFPTKGCSLSLLGRLYIKQLGSDYKFFLLKADYRRYHYISPTHTIAWQIFWKMTSGTVPFSEMSDLGHEMRGYNENKHVSDQMSLIRLENRIFPWRTGKLSRFGFAVFVETGNIFQNRREISWENQKLSGGFGLRYTLVPSTKLNLRVDFAFSEENIEIDIISFEAF